MQSSLLAKTLNKATALPADVAGAHSQMWGSIRAIEPAKKSFSRRTAGEAEQRTWPTLPYRQATAFVGDPKDSEEQIGD
jgi:hypothetical protein